MADMHVGDLGTTIISVIEENGEPLDISAATEHHMDVLYPDGSTKQWVTDFVTDGVDGKLQHITDAESLTQAGKYTYQMYILLPVWSGHSASKTFKVSETLRST